MTKNWFVQIFQEEQKMDLQGIKIFCDDHYIGMLDDITPSDAEDLKERLEAKVKE